MYQPNSKVAEEFISDQEIKDTLAYADANKDNRELILSIIEKAKKLKGLSHREASVLLACEDKELMQKVFDLAIKIKEEFYGNRIVMFAFACRYYAVWNLVFSNKRIFAGKYYQSD